MPNHYSTGADRGVAPYPNLDLSSNDWTFEERAEAVRWYELSHGTGDTRFAQFAPWMIDNNPGGFKRYRGLVPALTSEVPRGIFFVHSYAVTANADGCMYEMIVARQHGFSKRQILDTLNFAFLSGGPRAINAVSDVAGPWLDSWEDEDDAGRIVFPTDWSIDPSEFVSGLDTTQIPVSDADEAALRAWHERVNSEVPRFVDLWLKLRGPGYKANRLRYEQATSSAVLPKQIYPLLTMHLGAFEANPAVVRYALRQAKSIGGISRNHIVEIIDTAFVQGNEWKMAVILDGDIADTIEHWDD
ncbi:hypothetical protein CJ179_35065 [Rhodococcus sp. ACS1]|uniref:hypothetical protein n=1 Tax=Rhodococcus sp. ACS1 TaxID=2028570 RepID=UPI000BB0CD1D|nr:hypothetical protein [Rhodococcus sp. ACS1]PBC39278.1 hypothetical protein CJ179_35065 [Rhodococcus sp. ACS1]